MAHNREKGKGQERTVKKSPSGNISTILGKSHTVPLETKFCAVDNLPNVITCAKFQNEIFKGHDFTGGRISNLPY